MPEVIIDRDCYQDGRVIKGNIRAWGPVSERINVKVRNVPLDEEVVEAIYEVAPNTRGVYAEPATNRTFDTALLTRFPEFSWLRFDAPQAEDIDFSGLARLPRLVKVKVKAGRLKELDLSPLAGLASDCFERIDVSGPAERLDITGLSRCPGLKYFHVEGPHMKEVDLTPLSGAPDLVGLGVRSVKAPFRLMTEDGDDSTHVVLPECEGLVGVGVSRTHLLKRIDLSPLACSSRLKGLTLSSGLEEVDLSPLEGMTSLEKVSLWENPRLEEVDVGPVVDCPALKEFNLDAHVRVLVPNRARSMVEEKWWLRHLVERNPVTWY